MKRLLLLCLLLIPACQPKPEAVKAPPKQITLDEAKAAASEHRDEVTAFLTKAVTYRSVEDFGYQLNQPTVDLMQFVFQTAEGMGFKTKTAADGLVGVLEYGQGEETVGVLIHLDVVPVSEEEGGAWDQDPWGGEVIDDVLWGRGSQDDKGALASVLWAAKTLMDHQVTFNRKLQIILGTKEEKNFESLRRYLAENPQPDFGLVTDGVYIVRGQKGIADLDFQFKAAAEAGKDGGGERIIHWSGGTVVNTVPDSARLVIKTDDVAGSRKSWEAMIAEVTAELKTGRSDRFYGVTAPYEAHLTLLDWSDFADAYPTEGVPEGDLVLVSTGVAAHSSTPELGKNALVEVALVASQMIKDSDDVYGRTAKFLAEKIGLSTDASGLGIPYQLPAGVLVPPGVTPEQYTGTSVNPGVLEDVGQDGLVLRVNFRIGLSNSIDEVVVQSRSTLAGYQGVVADPEDGAAYRSYYIEDGDALLDLVKASYMETNGHEPVLTVGSGANYMMLVDNFVSYGPVDFFAPGTTDFDGSLVRFHQMNERMEVSMLELNIVNYALTLQRLLQVEAAPKRTQPKE